MTVEDNIFEEDMKVYMFFLETTGELYAFTADKDFSDKFRTLRKHLIYKKKKISQANFSLLAYLNRGCQIIEIPLFDGEQDLIVHGTMNEEDKLSQTCEEMYASLHSLQDEIVDSGWFTEDTSDILCEAASMISIKPDTGNTARIEMEVNTFLLFMDLNKKTFI